MLLRVDGIDVRVRAGKACQHLYQATQRNCGRLSTSSSPARLRLRSTPLPLIASSPRPSRAPGAACKLSNDKGEWHVNSTPGSVTIQKSFGDVAVDCEKPNGGKGASVFRSTAGPGVYGNILVGGIVGFAIDAGGGAGFDYPQLMSVEICNGVVKPEVLDEGKTTMALEQLGKATAFSKAAGCSPSADAAIKTAWGGERYKFSCSKRPTLHMECMYGCREIAPF